MTALPDGITTTSNGDGHFRLQRLTAGNISLQISSAFYVDRQYGPILCREGDLINLSVALTPVLVEVPGQEVIEKRPETSGYTVYARPEIKASSAADLGSFLEEQGYYTQTDGRAKYITIRGFAPASVLVLLDGQPINPDGGAADLSQIPTETAERIEVYTSGAATRFGANALGGAVNIISRRVTSGEQRSLNLTNTWGDYSLSRQTVSLNSGPVKDASLFLNYEYSRRQNDYLYEHPYLGELTRENNRQRFYSAFVSFNHATVKPLNLSLRLYNAHSGVPGAIFNESPTAAAKRDSRIVTLDYRRPELQLSAGYHELSQSFRDEDTFFPYDGHYSQIGRNLSAAWQKQVGQKVRLELGGRYLSESFFNSDPIHPTAALPSISRLTKSVFASAGITRPLVWLILKLDAGYRFDWLDSVSFTSPRFGFSLDHKPIFNLSVGIEGSYSESYRYPPIDALFWKEDVFVIGNPDLQPETAIARDWGVHWHFDGVIELEGKSIWFESDISDLIVWRRRFDGKYMPVNMDRAESRGNESSVALVAWDGRLHAGYTRTTLKAINKTEGAGYYSLTIPFKPDRVERFHLTLHWWRIKVNYCYTYNGKRFIREANTKCQPPHVLHDLNLEIRFNFLLGTQTLSIAWRNLKDKRYELLERMPMPPETVAITVGLEL